MRIIFDFDGTLCNIEHRTHFVRQEKPDWEAFYKACVRDRPVLPVIQTFIAFEAQNGFEVKHGGEPINHIEIWSGRSDIVEEESRAWLDHHAIPNRYLTRMRVHDDYRPDHELKQKWLNEFVAEHGMKPDIVFDDRQKVVDMWRANGIVCAQVNQWEE